jgi:hypothetical protein
LRKAVENLGPPQEVIPLMIHFAALYVKAGGYGRKAFMCAVEASIEGVWES